MKIGKTTEILKKAAAMCKSKTSRLLILASLQRRRMAVVCHKIDALIEADWERVHRHKALVQRTVDKRPVIVHESDLEANFSHHLAMLSQQNGHGGCLANWTSQHLFNDDHNNCCYTDDVLMDSCNQNGDKELSVMDVITNKNNREVEGLEFNMEEDIDQAADMFIRKFRQRLNEGL